MKYYLPLGCWLHISSSVSLLLWLLGAVVYLTLLETALLKSVEVQTEYLYHFSKNIQSSGSSLMWAVQYRNETRKRDFKLARLWKTTYLWVLDFIFCLVTGCICECLARLSTQPCWRQINWNQIRCKLNTYIIIRGIYNSLVRVWSMWLSTLMSQRREILR